MFIASHYKHNKLIIRKKYCVNYIEEACQLDGKNLCDTEKFLLIRNREDYATSYIHPITKNIVYVERA